MPFVRETDDASHVPGEPGRRHSEIWLKLAPLVFEKSKSWWLLSARQRCRRYLVPSKIDPQWPLDRWCSGLLWIISSNEIVIQKKNGFGSKRNQMALRRRFRYRIQAFSVELSTIIPKVTVSSLHLSPYFIEFQANQLKIHKKKITENDKILCAILFFKKKKKLLRIQHFLMKKKIPARNRGMLIFFSFSSRSFASPKGSPQNRHGRSSSRSSQ